MPDQQRDIALKRSWLQEKVDTFQKQAASVLNTVSSDGDDSWDDDSAREMYAGVEFDGIGEERNNDEHASSAEAEERQSFAYGSPDSCIDAEQIALHLPSHLGRNWCDSNSTEDLARAELRIREGQLNDTLHQICIIFLGMMFGRHVPRGSKPGLGQEYMP
jgi:hypothetical protein